MGQTEFQSKQVGQTRGGIHLSLAWDVLLTSFLGGSLGPPAQSELHEFESQRDSVSEPRVREERPTLGTQSNKQIQRRRCCAHWSRYRAQLRSYLAAQATLLCMSPIAYCHRLLSQNFPMTDRISIKAGGSTRGGIHLSLAWLGLAWLGLAWLGLAWLGLAWLGLAWLGLAWLGLAWLGLAWLGLAWLGLAWLGLAWLGLAWLGLAWPTNRLAWLGLAWLGLAWLGLAWLGLGCPVDILPRREPRPTGPI